MGEKRPSLHNSKVMLTFEVCRSPGAFCWSTNTINTMEIDNAVLGHRLAEVRGLRRKTQDEAAVDMYMTREAISRREQGKVDISAVELINFMKLYRYRIEVFVSPDYRASDGMLPDE